MTQEQFLMELKVYILRNFGTQSKAAKHWGFSVAYLSAITTGRKKVPDWLLDQVGYKRETTVTEKFIAMVE